MDKERAFKIRYTALAVGLKPSANQGKARQRGLYRIIYSKTISGDADAGVLNDHLHVGWFTSHADRDTSIP